MTENRIDEMIKLEAKYDGAIIGTDENQRRIAYDFLRLEKIVMEKDGLDVEAADEWIFYQFAPEWAKTPNYPILITPMS
jgi:hypothetical protein